MIREVYRRFIQFYKNLPIKRKLYILFYIQIIIPIIFISYYTYHVSAQAIRNKSLNYSQDILRMIELRFEDLSNNINSMSLQILYDNRIYDYLKNENSADNISEYTNSNYIKNILRDAVLSRNELQSICIVTSKGNNLYFDSNNGEASIKDILPYEDVYKQAITAKGKIKYIIEEKDGEVKNIYAARVIYDRDNYTAIGLITMLISKDFIESVYKDLSDETLKNISILTQDNKNVIEPTVDNDSISKNFDAISNNSKRGYYIDKKQNILVSYVVLRSPDWKIVYHIGLKDLYKDINKLRIDIIFIVLISIMLLSILSGLTSEDIVKPINQLVAGMKKLENNKNHEDIIMNRNDELGFLGESFNRMSSKIDYLVNMIYKENLTRKDAELKALQAQINPHFLYNTLENINWMAQLNGVTEISETVTALASLMEASIGRDDKLITVKDELNYVDNYIAILKNRFGDRLCVVKSVSSEVGEILIPRLLVQPLVENSIKHGVESLTRQGIIKINAFFKENDAVIEVIDNGKGMDPESLDKLNGFINSNDVEEGCVGLRNVNKRIKLFYGEDFGISVDSKKDEYTKVTIRIPQKVK